AVVRVALRPDGKEFESTRADARANYALASLPSGTYDVAVAADGGLYVVGSAIALQPGEKRSLSLSLKAAPEEGTQPPPPEQPAGEKDKEKEKGKEGEGD